MTKQTLRAVSNDEASPQPLSARRQGLAADLQASRLAILASTHAGEALARVHSLQRVEPDARAAVDAVECEAAKLIEQWAENAPAGASPPPMPPELVAKLRKAREALSVASATAAAARNAEPRLAAAAQAARHKAADAMHAIQPAIVGVVVETELPDWLAEGDEIAVKYRAWRLKGFGIAHDLRSVHAPPRPAGPMVNNTPATLGEALDAAKRIEDRLDQPLVSPDELQPPQREREHAAQPYREYRQRLARDANAMFAEPKTETDGDTAA